MSSTKETQTKKKLSKYERMLLSGLYGPAKVVDTADQNEEEQTPEDRMYAEFVAIVMESCKMSQVLSPTRFLEFLVLIIRSFSHDTCIRMGVESFERVFNLKQFKGPKFSNKCSFLPVLYPRSCSSDSSFVRSHAPVLLCSAPHFGQEQQNIFALQYLSSVDLQWYAWPDIHTYQLQERSADILAVLVPPVPDEQTKLFLVRTDGLVLEENKVSVAAGTARINVSKRSQNLHLKLADDNEDHDSSMDVRDKAIIRHCWQQSMNGHVFMVVLDPNRREIQLFNILFGDGAWTTQPMRSLDYGTIRDNSIRASFGSVKMYGAYYHSKRDTLYLLCDNGGYAFLIIVGWNYLQKKQLCFFAIVKLSGLYYSVRSGDICLYYVKEKDDLFLFAGCNMQQVNIRNLEKRLQVEETHGNLLLMNTINMSGDGCRDYKDIFKDKWNDFQGSSLIADYNQKCVFRVSQTRSFTLPYDLTKYTM